MFRLSSANRASINWRPDRLKALSAGSTRSSFLKIKWMQLNIAAGRDAGRANDVYRRFLASSVSTASSRHATRSVTRTLFVVTQCKRRKMSMLRAVVTVRACFRHDS